MYKFLIYKADYEISDSVSYPNGDVQKFSCLQTVDARYDTLSGSYMFTLSHRKEVYINSVPPTNAMDIFMQKLGDVLFPLVVVADAYGTIRKIKDFDAYKVRWEDAVNSIQNEYKHSIYISNYIDMCRKKVRTQREFMDSLWRSTFFQYYFFNRRNTKCSLYGFPSRDDENAIELMPMEEPAASMEQYRTSDDASIKGNIKIHRDHFGILERCVSSFDFEDPKTGSYRKDIQIIQVEKSRKVSSKSWLTL